MNKDKRTLIISMGLIAVILTGLFINLTWTDGDEGRYALLAKSIAQGSGQSEIYLPEPEPEWLTPPVYPYLLGGLTWLFGFSIPLLKIFSAICYIFFAALIAAWVSRMHPLTTVDKMTVFALGTCTVFGLSFSWFMYSEALYLLASYTTLLYALKADRVKQAASTGLLAGLALLIRPVGLALLPAIFMHYACRKKWRHASVFIGSAIAVNLITVLRTYQLLGVPFAYMAHYGGETSSGGLLAGVSTILNAMIQLFPQHYFVGMPHSLFFSLFNNHNLLSKVHLSFLTWPLMLSIAGIVTIGFISRIKKWSALEWYWMTFWPMISTYHVHLHRGIEYRYFLPLMPLIGLYFVTGIRYLFSLAPEKPPVIGVFKNILLAVIALYVLATATVAGSGRVRHEWALRKRPSTSPERLLVGGAPDQIAFGRYIEACEWIREHTPSNAVIISRKPRHTYLISNRKGHRYDGVDVRGSNTWAILTHYADTHPVYVLEDAFLPESSYGRDRIYMLEPVLNTHRDRLQLIYTSAPPTCRIFKLTR